MQETYLAEIPAGTAGTAQDSGKSLPRPLHYFNIYRLAVASVFIVMPLRFGGAQDFGSQDPALFFATSLAYWLAALAFLLAKNRLHLRIDFYLTLQVALDILFLTLLMYASGGYKSGMPFMMLVVLAAAGLVGQGRLTLFYAALATLGVFVEYGFRLLHQPQTEGPDITQIGFTSIGFFATAITAYLLAQRVSTSEQLARRRGAALSNQLRINDQVIRDMQDGVLVVDSNGRVSQHNPQAEKLLGTVEPVTQVLSAYSRPLAEHLNQTRKPGNDTLSFLAPGSGKTLLARFVAAGEGGDMLIYLEDLDRTQALMQQLKLAALGRLTAGIAHEIRNPLAAISHAAELLYEDDHDATQMRLISIINDNTQRLNLMVRDVLDLGRRDRIEPEIIQLQPFLGTFADNFCAQENIEREVIAADIPAGTLLSFDRAHLHQILWNLLSNALRHCSGGTAAVKISARPGPREGIAARQIELHIVDNGAGVAAGVRGQIFEPFFTTDNQGTGLGLYIARELSDANGATLELLENAPGAHFCLTGRDS